MSLSEPNVILHGGPISESDPQRLRRVVDIEATLKILMGNAYEHFRPTAKTIEHGERHLLVFEWTGRTYVAE